MTLVIAHRGASYIEKENTLSAFEKAVEMKADGIEFDVRKTKDDKMIIFHDDKIKGKKVNEIDLRELKDLVSYEIPSYEETLKKLKGRIKLDIELKEEGYEEEFLKITLKYLKPNKFFISSFSTSSLRKIKEINANVNTGLLISLKKIQFYRLLYTYYPKKQIEYSKCDYICPYHRYVNRKFLYRAISEGKKVVAWTVDESENIQKLKEIGVYGIITNRLDNALTK